MLSDDLRAMLDEMKWLAQDISWQVTDLPREEAEALAAQRIAEVVSALQQVSRPFADRIRDYLVDRVGAYRMH